jgi:SPP1 gp7 family putative phage head morphogenesis protein
MAVMSLKTFLSLHHSMKTKLKLRGKRKVFIKPGRPSRANELWYKVELLNLVRYIRSVTEKELLPLIKHHSFGGDALPPSIAHQINMVSKKFGNINATATRLSRLAAQKNLAATDKQLVENIKKAIGVDIQPILSNDGIRDEMLKAVNANVELITSIPEQYFQKLRDALDKNWEAGERWEDLSDLVEHVGDVTESRAKLIARDQTSKMNGAFNRARQTSIGIKKYKWQTAGDERVRPTHHDNDGKVFSWDSPPSETGNPGDDVNCRCVGLPEFDLDDDE